MKHLRKVIILIMVLALLVSFTACAKSGTDASDPTGETEHHIVGIYTEPSEGNDSGEESTAPSVEATEPVEEATQPSEPEVAPTEPSQPVEESKPSAGNEGTKPTEPKPSTGNSEPTKPSGNGGSSNDSGSTTPTNPQPTEPKPTNPQPTTPSHTHSYSKVVTKPTCTADGYTTYTCSCGDTYKADTTKATGHSYQVTSKVNPTCTKDGSTTYKCGSCNDTYTETLTKVPHDWEHHHTDEVSHTIRVLVCTCGWTCTESEATAAGYSTLVQYYGAHAKASGEPWEHSYDIHHETIIDVPATDSWTCKGCGTTTTTQP